MRFASSSTADKAASPSSSSSSPASRLLQKLKGGASSKATASGDAKTSPVSAPAAPSQPAAVQPPTASSSSSAGECMGAPVRRSSATPPRPAAPAGTKSTTAAPRAGSQGSEWQRYRESRLSKVAKWLQIFLVALLFVALYCGDLTPAAMRSTAVLDGVLAQAKQAARPFLALPANRYFGLTKAWNTVSDSMPAPVALLTPRASPALERGAVLYAGDFIYSCRPAPANTKKKGEAAASPCNPTFFHLRDDGTLVLARGTTPSKPHKPLWTSQTPKPCKKCGAKACACRGRYRAVFNRDGNLEVKQGNGKTVWKRGFKGFFLPKVLRPWPLAK